MTSPPRKIENRIDLLDTLAQKRTRDKDRLILFGKGSDIQDKKALLGRAKRKTITQAMALSLVDCAISKGRVERTKTYWNTYYCQNWLITHEGKFHGKYCKNRFCTVCSSIRKATIINKYSPVLKNWKNSYFVTLTVKAIPAKHLRKYFKGMLKLISKIIDKHRKRRKRGSGFALEGIKSLECNFNSEKRTYNPHFHVLLKNKEMAEVLIKEWLFRFKPKYANKVAQHMRKVQNTERDLMEIVKYGSKIFTDSHLAKIASKSNGPSIYVSALDNILTAMTGLRIFDRFGFNLPKENLPKNPRIKHAIHYEEWLFNSRISDWFNIDTGETLTHYEVSGELSNILTNNIDSRSQ